MDLTLPVPPVSSLPGCEGPALRPLLTEPEGVLPAGGGVGVTQVEETHVLLTSLDTTRSSSSQFSVIDLISLMSGYRDGID